MVPRSLPVSRLCALALALTYATLPVVAAPPTGTPVKFEPRMAIDASGFSQITSLPLWNPSASLQEIADHWRGIGHRQIANYDRDLADGSLAPSRRMARIIQKSMLLIFEGDADAAQKVLIQGRSLIDSNSDLGAEWLYTVIYLQGVVSLRQGENDNCINCRGESACILPLAPSAVHTVPSGSRTAIAHFTEYLNRFPDDLEVRWLLNVAYMTLGEHPHKVDTRFLVSIYKFSNSEFNIGAFRDIAPELGLSRFNQAGGAIMDDFDNDNLLDFVVTSQDPTLHMAIYRNKGDGTFEDRTKAAGLLNQLGGLNCVQADYNNDGHLDIFVPRSAWYRAAIRPSLLRNTGDGTFTDVTEAAGLLEPLNSNSATWADYDNDGNLDLFVCCERQPNRLYRNKGDGTFEEVAYKAGLIAPVEFCKGAAWLDYDNDRYPDLFFNNLHGSGRLFRNRGNGTFAEVTYALGLDGPRKGFSCWAFDYNNDGFLDIFATSYERTTANIVRGIIGEPHGGNFSKLYKNLGGKGFQDVAKEVGLDGVYATMGSNFGDFDNDGFPDIYLATGEPSIATLVPNRMFKNVAGKRFADITSSSRTGHLQKGHGVACGDFDRDGDVDLFVQTGGAINGDKYHNLLFENHDALYHPLQRNPKPSLSQTEPF